MKTRVKTNPKKKNSIINDIIQHKPTLKCGRNKGTIANGGQVTIEVGGVGYSEDDARAHAYINFEREGSNRLAYWINSQKPPLTCPIKVVDFEINCLNDDSGIELGEIETASHWFKLKGNYKAIITCKSLIDGIR